MIPRVLTTARLLAAAALAVLLTAPGAAAQEEPDPAAEAPFQAGTSFRTATVLDESTRLVQPATLGEYLYWVLPVAAGRDATVTATVRPGGDGGGQGATWRLDVYDGLRRLQPCVAGEATAAGPGSGAGPVTLDCTLRTVRPWAEPWSNDPLAGAYYVRLTAVDLPEQDLGLPVEVTVEATTVDAGGSRASGGELGAPLVLTSRAGAVDTRAAEDAAAEDAGTSAPAEDAGTSAPAEDDGGTAVGLLPEPASGWFGGWWTDRWLWTAVGGILAALAAITGNHLVRRRA